MTPERDKHIGPILLFDIGNVVTLSDQMRTICYLDERYNVPKDRAKRFFTDPEYKLFSRGEITEFGYVMALQHSLGFPQLTIEAARIAHNLHIHAVNYRVVDFIKKLSGNGSRIVYVTDTNMWQTQRQEELLTRAGLSLPRVFRSHELGVNKADKSEPAYFSLVLNSLRVEPENVLLIDDSLANLEAAALLGIPGIQFSDAKHLENDLTSIW